MECRSHPDAFHLEFCASGAVWMAPVDCETAFPSLPSDSECLCGACGDLTVFSESETENFITAAGCSELKQHEIRCFDDLVPGFVAMCCFWNCIRIFS